jgi:hypothetical protein
MLNGPLIFHCPGSCRSGIYNEELYQSWGKVMLRSPKVGNLLETTIITWNNLDTKGILEISLDKLGLPYRVLGKSISTWSNIIKINLTIEELKNINTRYVLGVDSFDAVVTGNPESRLDILQKCDLVFNGSNLGLMGGKQANDLCDMAYANYPYRYLNAGAWLGKRDFCLEFFNHVLDIDQHIEEYLKDIPPEMIDDYLKSEQFRVKLAFVDCFPRVGIDCRRRLFQYFYPLSHLPYSNLKIL